MKIIVQWMPDAVERVSCDLDENNFIVDIDTYEYFLNEVFWKGIQEYVEKKYKVKFKDSEDVGGAKTAEKLYYNQKLISKYWPKYDKIRDKFYLYNDAIYSYIFIGFINVGHVIEICRYDLSDLVNICNRLADRGCVKA